METTIIHVTDVHGDLDRIGEAVKKAPPYSIVAVSGDIHDWDARRAKPEELEAHLKTLRQLAAMAKQKGCYLVVCSGNHDAWAATRPYHWLAIQEDNLLGDFSNAILNLNGVETIVTCFPWRQAEGQAQEGVIVTVRKPPLRADIEAQGRIRQMLAEGRRWQMEKARPWVWLHHNPPSKTAASGGRDASDILVDWIHEFHPTAVLSGHIHTAPFIDGGSPLSYLGTTLVSNPGTTKATVRLNQISITQEGGAWKAAAKWSTASLISGYNPGPVQGDTGESPAIIIGQLKIPDRLKSRG